MPSYTKNEAREWAHEKLRGVANVVIPTFTSDFKGLNEKAIRHDVETSIKHGFTGGLACSEVAMSLDEYGQFCRVMCDQGGRRFQTIHHAVFNSLEDNIEAAKLAEDAGAELVLLGYPPSFFPDSLEGVYEYTKAFCDATNMAVMLFPVGIWGFGRFDPDNIPVPMLRRMIDDIPNIVAIKAEGDLMSILDVHRNFHEEVVISVPVEPVYIPLAQMLPIPYCGTNFSAYYGPYLPRMYDLIQKGQYAEVLKEYQRLTPARQAFMSAPRPAGGLINRLLWKYQGWLQGYNGGPLRHPTARIDERTMEGLRRAQAQSGMEPTTDPLASFFVGRNPL